MDESFKEKLRYWREHGLQISPKFKTQPWKNSKAGSNAQYNGWERGIPTDAKGLPYLDNELSPIGQKAWSEKYRRIAEDHRLT